MTTDAPRIVLASSSPRRAAYLKALGFGFHRVSPHTDETRLSEEPPHDYVERLAVAKAREVAKKYPNDWVLGGDTTVVIDGRILGKPDDTREAQRMLTMLSGRSHRVLSGLALVNRAKRYTKSAVATTTVWFRSLSSEEIVWYLEAGEALDKAGAYAIQEKGGILVERIEGSFSNVVGFPVETFYTLWRDAGLPLPKARKKRVSQKRRKA
jgi:septum formation protein